LESWPRAKVLNICERKNLTIVFLNWPRVGIFAVQGETYLRRCFYSGKMSPESQKYQTKIYSHFGSGRIVFSRLVWVDP
jgi:hypothetical protein